MQKEEKKVLLVLSNNPSEKQWISPGTRRFVPDQQKAASCTESFRSSGTSPSVSVVVGEAHPLPNRQSG